MSYIQGQEVQEAKEAIESARASLSQKKKEKKRERPRKVVCRHKKGTWKKKKRKEKDQGRQEGGSAKARFRVSFTKNFLLGSQVFGL